MFEFFKQSAPTYAYASGLDEYAGKLFIPFGKNLESFCGRVEELRLKSENESQMKRLESLSASYCLQEPHQFPGWVLNSYSVHLTKEGIIPGHMIALTRNAVKGFQVGTKEHHGKDWPVGQRILTLIRCNGIQKVIKIIDEQTMNKRLKQLLGDLGEAAGKYASLFNLNGFNTGGFEEVDKIITRDGAQLGRGKIYARALKMLWDYRETPSEVEENSLRLLNRELPHLVRITAELARKYKVGSKPEELSKAIRLEKSLKPTEVIPFLRELRKLTVTVVNKTIVRVNRKYDTRVIETPPYLSGVIATAGAYSFDGFTDDPKEIFMITTSQNRESHRAPSELLQLLVHEEYGHNVHSSNSSLPYETKPTLTDMLWSPLKAIMLGIYFQREAEFQGVMEKLRDGKHLNRDEKLLAEFFEGHGGMQAFAEEYEFHTCMWRVIRFLRAIGDARINSDKQSLLDFIEWASKMTGLSKATVYYQVFPSHQGVGPGYATTYAVMGEIIREIQNKAIRNGKSILDFNTYACSIGYPPKTIFEERLRAFASM